MGIDRKTAVTSADLIYKRMVRRIDIEPSRFDAGETISIAVAGNRLYFSILSLSKR